MQLAKIQISTQAGFLGIQKQDAKLHIQQPPAEMKMRQPQADIQYEKTKGRLQIDQSEAFAEANLKPITQQIREWASKARQKLKQGLAEEAREGDQLMKIEGSKKSMIPQIAKQESEPSPKTVNSSFLPSTPEKVKFHYTPSNLEINIKANKAIIEAKPHMPRFQYQPGDISIYLKQKAAITFKIAGGTIDLQR
ncbi:hypothetical protein ABE29_18745 [Cytobacillus firmus]|uniref:DUF6470 family protein n=1 Tax=Cytobacillus firmus TaxID=1399 RepID=UPI00077CBADF|nr:DUF6470 family protein [Cytobacillus firmus]MBG9544721.1 hypothetical protein [Cytobacillus firmus]MBG9554000.1 hypothetical protein [Cytobacillus firmus]MBG9558468.1 hypothetical protein [Cytobacillus firmus]MBG9576989.1 hypothetical protein [Cytobacillus firmus]MEC1894360.1 DUF6470 family protein [Cytobacillus firmus]